MVADRGLATGDNQDCAEDYRPDPTANNRKVKMGGVSPSTSDCLIREANTVPQNASQEDCHESQVKMVS
jgi:hypothetical protein